MRVLLIEDEQRLAENIVDALRESGLAVDHAPDGEVGLDLAARGVYDTVVLDLMLPRKNGQTVLRELRRGGIHTPVLILTAQEGTESVVSLLNSGADDYLSKPFDLGELLARIKALIRRAQGVATPVLTISDLELDTVQQTVRRRERPVELSPTEYRILEYFMHRPRAVVSQQELLEHLYDFDWEHHSNVIEAHISNLRRKLNSAGAEPLIETLRHRGYRLRQGGTVL
jgi:DNA-binding response OmpR family regulator